MAVAAVETVGLGKTYGAVVALRSIDLTIEAGAYFVLLGPSGGGKTTLLRLLGGFLRPTTGHVLLHGVDVSDLPPNRRPTAMVFQSYALFPHMSVAENVGYGLKLRRLPKPEIAAKVDAMLEMVGLTGLGARRPWELSGGQQQRVQLARALVLEADILLLDEPLAALDAKLRKEMCIELKDLQARVGITFVHVTHNQEEAMTVADRIAIVADGEIVEEGTTQQIYERPRRRFTADFIGENNIFDGRVTAVDGGLATLDVGVGEIRVPTGGQAVAPGAPASCSVRSEHMRIAPEDGAVTLTGRYHETVYLGLLTSHLVTLPNGRQILVRAVSDLDRTEARAPGSEVTVGWRPEAGRLHLA